MDFSAAAEERSIHDGLRRRLDEVNSVAKAHLSPIQDHINFTLQQAYFKCAYECFDRRMKQEQIGSCVEHCSTPVLTAQNLVENEMAKLQNGLANPNLIAEALVDHWKNVLEQLVAAQAREEAFIGSPPLFVGTNYPHWKARMQAFIQALGFNAWSMVETEWSAPTTTKEDGTVIAIPRTEWTRAQKELWLANSRVLNAIFQAVDDKQFVWIATCKTAASAWKNLQAVHEGVYEGLRDAKLSKLTMQLNELKMEEDETIVEYIGKVLDIANQAHDLGKSFSEELLVRKTLGSLPDRFFQKVVIERARDLSSLKLDELRDSLQAWEINHGPRNASIINAAQNVESKKVKGTICCYECGERGHVRSICPNSKYSEERKKRVPRCPN